MLLLALVLLALPLAAQAQQGLEAVTVTAGPDGGQTYSLSLQVLALMTVLTLLPAILLMMTSFTRIIVVLAIMRQAIGTAQTPSNQVLLGLALFLTFFVMAPVAERVYSDGVQPYLAEEVSADQAVQNALAPVRQFMLAQTREADLALYADLSGREGFETEADVPLSILLPAFVTSELKTAFQMGFVIFIPFVVIDLVVASILMSMGMVMLSPMIISLPFKIMLFVLIDGWSLVTGTLARSFLM